MPRQYKRSAPLAAASYSSIVFFVLFLSSFHRHNRSSCTVPGPFYLPFRPWRIDSCITRASLLHKLEMRFFLFLQGLIVSLATGIFALPQHSVTFQSESNSWATVRSDGVYSTEGFGGITNSTGSGDTYVGNVGNPYGSNIIEVSASDASSYKYVVRFQNRNANDWSVIIWNKHGPDGKMDGWYGKGCKRLTIRKGLNKYVAFGENSQGGWTAAQGSIPTDREGGFASTWGEFDSGSTINEGWSGFDVSAIQAQNAGYTVQGMKICDALGLVCSSITADAANVENAYVNSLKDDGGIGVKLRPGAVRLSVSIGFDV